MNSVQVRDYKNGRIHFIGIGGCSMSGLAQILDNMGYTVSGSDQAQSQFTDALSKRGIPFHIGHSADYVAGACIPRPSSPPM